MKVILNGETAYIPFGNVKSSEINTIEVISREEYDALPNRPSTTLYFILG